MLGMGITVTIITFAFMSGAHAQQKIQTETQLKRPAQQVEAIDEEKLEKEKAEKDGKAGAITPSNLKENKAVSPSDLKENQAVSPSKLKEQSRPEIRRSLPKDPSNKQAIDDDSATPPGPRPELREALPPKSIGQPNLPKPDLKGGFAPTGEGTADAGDGDDGGSSDAPTGPVDLDVSGFPLPAVIEPSSNIGGGTEITVRAQITNRLEADLNQDFDISYYYCPRSRSSNSSGCTHLQDRRVTYDFRALSGANFDQRLIVPRELERGSAHSIYFEVDSGDVISETDESNNTGSARLIIDAQPDLELVDASTSGGTTSGEMATVEWTVRNHDLATDGYIVSLQPCRTSAPSSCYSHLYGDTDIPSHEDMSVSLLPGNTHSGSQSFEVSHRYVRVHVGPEGDDPDPDNNSMILDLRPGT